MAAGSVGGSYESYNWAGHQWALPIDAAAQVQAWVPSRIAGPPADWNAVSALARDGRLALALRPPHSLMSLFTISGLLGVTLPVGADALFPDSALGASKRRRTLTGMVGPDSSEQDTIPLRVKRTRNGE